MQKKLPKIINQDEFEKILRYTLTKKPRNYKIKAIAMLLGFEAGLRISEIVGLKHPQQDWKIQPLTKDNISFDKNQIRVESGKGGKDRIVPLPKRFKKSYLEFLPLKIDRRALQFYVTGIGKQILGRDISFHTLRHGFATHIAQNRPLHEVQMLMGHSRLDTTGVYLHANPKEAVDKARELF